MGNMIKPVDYANKLGISRQAVYAKIKKGILSSKNVDGKLYIVLDEKTNSNCEPKHENARGGASVQKGVDHSKLLAAKDETIAVLKETVVDLKETNKMITSTLRGEVDLLKEAFGEMKMLYRLQLENKTTEQVVVENRDEQEDEIGVWLELDNFYNEYGITKKKKKKDASKRLKKLFKKSDPRVDKYDDKIVYLSNANFDDILAKV